MKKIASVAVLAAVATAFASAEVKVEFNHNTVLNAYQKESLKKASSDNKDTETWMNFDESKENLSITVENDYAGVSADIEIDNMPETTEYTVINSIKGEDTDSLSLTTVGDLKGSVETDTVAVPGTEIHLDSVYYGWFKFGALKFTAGRFNSRFTKNHKDSFLEGGLTDDKRALFGLSRDEEQDEGTGLGNKTFMIDANNITTVNGKRQVSAVADYTFADVAGGKLLLKVAAVRNKDGYRSDADAADKLQRGIGAGFAASAALQREDFSFEAVARTQLYNDILLGGYLSLNNIENTKVVLGGTFGSASKGNEGTSAAPKAGKKNTHYFDAFAADLRVVSNPSEKTEFRLVGKYEWLRPKHADDPETAVTLLGEVGYDVNDLIAVSLGAGIKYDDLDDNDKSDTGDNVFIIQPSVAFKAGEGAALTASINYETALNTGDMDDKDTVSTFTVPVSFKVEL